MENNDTSNLLASKEDTTTFSVSLLMIAAIVVILFIVALSARPGLFRSKEREEVLVEMTKQAAKSCIDKGGIPIFNLYGGLARCDK